MSLLLAMMLTAEDSSKWRVEMVWGCQFEETGREPYLIQGRLASRPHPINPNERERAMQILNDESGRFEDYVARPPYYVNPRPGEHWVILNAGRHEGLFLSFPEGEQIGTAKLALGDTNEPAATAKCGFKEFDA